MPSGPTHSDRSIRVMRIIARLNIGGPAVQAITLTKRLEPFGFSTILVRGSEERDEGNMDDLADQLGVVPTRIPWLGREPSWRDAVALGVLIRMIWRQQPQIIHTHAAKAGTLGRVAAILVSACRRTRPVLIHTFHGHSLTGYFSPRTASVYRFIERWLARRTDRLIAVSEEVRDELVALGIAPSCKFEVIRLGLDLSKFEVPAQRRSKLREALRAELGIPVDACVITLVARLVPIKRVDRFLLLARALSDLEGAWFLVVGDGQLRESLRASSDAQALQNRLVWAGFRADMPAVYFASDVVVQTSDNEGTPVALIEAQAAGVPVASTRVGGTASLVPPNCLADAEDLKGLVQIVRTLASAGRTPGRSSAASGVASRYGIERLISDLVELYQRELVGATLPPTPAVRIEAGSPAASGSRQ